MKIVKFKKWDCKVVKEHYNNLVIALCLYDVNTNEPVAIATVNLPQYGLESSDDNLTFIKNWAENEGILECLVENGIVEDLDRKVPTGNVWANLVKVLI